MNTPLDPWQRPRLSRAARLRFDERTQTYVLLSPERGLRLNESATAVVQRCDGRLTVQEIVEDLIRHCAVEPAGASAKLTSEHVTPEVVELLAALHARRLVVFEPLS